MLQSPVHSSIRIPRPRQQLPQVSALQMIMASSAEDIVKLLNPSQQLVPEPAPASKDTVGYSAAGYSRCELMKEATKKSRIPMDPQPAPEATANVVPGAEAPATAAPECDPEPVAEPTRKRTRTAAHGSRAPSPAISAAVENVSAPGSTPHGGAPRAPVLETENVPDDAENSTLRDNSADQLPADEPIKVPATDATFSYAETAKPMSPCPAAELPAPLHDPSSDTPAPSNLLALASRSGSEAAPASPSPNAGGATSVAAQPVADPAPPAAMHAPDARPPGAQLSAGGAVRDLVFGRMRGSGDAVLRSDSESDAGSKGAPDACMYCTHVHRGSEGYRAAEKGTTRGVSGHCGLVGRLRGSGESTDEPMRSPEEGSAGEDIEIVQQAKADAENEPAEGFAGGRGRGQGAGEVADRVETCLLYTSPSPRDRQKSRMPSSA